MSYQFKLMSQEEAEHIAYHWHYEGDYAFYDMEADEEDLREFLDPEERGESKFTVKNGQEIVGFLSFHQTGDQTIDIGLGMRPDLTDKGKGLEFLEAGVEFAHATYGPEQITLSVATFNQRAIKVYKRFGFEEVETFMQETNGSRFEFLKMSYSY